MERLAGFDAHDRRGVKGPPFTRERLARLPDLRLLVTTGMGNASIDMAAARQMGVVVSGTGGLLMPTVELTWGLIISLARHIPAEERDVREGGWQRTVGTDLHGATLGLVGLGNLGAAVDEGRPGVRHGAGRVEPEPDRRRAPRRWGRSASRGPSCSGAPTS